MIHSATGWDGKVSIFAHSLGSVITYDLLTHGAGERSPNGVLFPGLEFEVENFFGAGYESMSPHSSMQDIGTKDS